MGLGSTRALPTLPCPRTSALAPCCTPGCTQGPLLCSLQPLGCTPGPCSVSPGFSLVFAGASIHSQEHCSLLSPLFCSQDPCPQAGAGAAPRTLALHACEPWFAPQTLGYFQAPCQAPQGLLPALKIPAWPSWLRLSPLPCIPVSPAQLPGDMPRASSPPKHPMPSP